MELKAKIAFKYFGSRSLDTIIITKTLKPFAVKGFSVFDKKRLYFKI